MIIEGACNARYTIYDYKKVLFQIYSQNYANHLHHLTTERLSFSTTLAL